MKIHLSVDIRREIVSMKSQSSVPSLKSVADVVAIYDSFVKRLKGIII